MTIKDVSERFQMNWHTVKEIEKEYLKKKHDHIKIKGVEYIAIDEFAIQKGHKYMTVVMDLRSSRILYVGDGRAASCLDGFWHKIKKYRSNIKAVAMDMWPAYVSMVTKHIPKADIVYDWFHIVRNINKWVDQLRGNIIREEKELEMRKILKGKKWILLKTNENLKENESEKLKEALALNRPLMQMYYLKEDLIQIWKYSKVNEADKFLNKWCKKAQNSGVPIIVKMANQIASHRTGILNWIKHKISTGPLEGFNNKIKVLKRRAYGYRDLEYFKLKILEL
jgi:transposase